MGKLLDRLHGLLDRVSARASELRIADEALGLPAVHPQIEHGKSQVPQSVMKQSSEIINDMFVLIGGYTAGQIGGGRTSILHSESASNLAIR